VSVCDLETSTMDRSKPEQAVTSQRKRKIVTSVSELGVINCTSAEEVLVCQNTFNELASYKCG
jgi:hypothetical protein